MKARIYIYDAAEAQAGMRLDTALAALCEGLSRSAAQKLLEEGRVLVGGRLRDKHYRLKAGDRIQVEIPPPVPLEVAPEPIALDIVYEDDDLIVVNKPKGMVVHPAAGNHSGTLVNALLYHCAGSLSGINGVTRPGIVHRLDKDTSGLLIVAKNDLAHRALAEQIKAHSFTRVYEALVAGNVRDDAGVVNAPIGRHPVERKRMAVTDKNSKPAVTHYEVIARYRGCTHLRLRLETGRTHQIRVHMAYIGHPVLGDTLYGPKKPFRGMNGQCLHARTIGFIHPSTGAYMEFTSELPGYFQSILSTLQKEP